MELKSFNAEQVQSQINAVVDQFEKNAEQAIKFVQPESTRETVASLTKAYFDFTRSSIDNAAAFNQVVNSINQEFIKTLSTKK